jgi:DNA (cytosine-5)-methyltransferase 1
LIPIVDIFAGPGGLGEGFCSLLDDKNKRIFEIVLSIEKDYHAHATLTLRSFFRQFDPGYVPADYYEFVRGNISIEELYQRHPYEARIASTESWNATLGESKGAVSNREVDQKICQALKGQENWLLIGGPPCQAYSVVGRSRRQETILDEKRDERVGLYKQYLRILAVHNPTVFVMENVKGLLSAETNKSSVFKNILKDLSNPLDTYRADYRTNRIDLNCPGYKIYSLAIPPNKYDEEGNPSYNPKDFVIRTENYGIPQTRHRVILLGIRRDIGVSPGTLSPMPEIGIAKVLSDLPKLRSTLSRQKDNGDNWKKAITKILKKGMLTGVEEKVKLKVHSQIKKIRIPLSGNGRLFIGSEAPHIEYRPDWYLDSRLHGVCNHEARSHMDNDLMRYFFASCFGRVKGRSPKLQDFPVALLPEHINVHEGIDDKKFADRFRVQLSNKPSKTITSHISKDGHYYIHYDPSQCRSFTVREAARIQTFPDNYFFCGPRTAQFSQVGNAVPPLLANKIAEIIFPIFLQRSTVQSPISHISPKLTSPLPYELENK